MARFTDSNNNYVLNGISDPVAGTDAANKSYVDNHAGTQLDVDVWRGGDTEYFISTGSTNPNEAGEIRLVERVGFFPARDTDTLIPADVDRIRVVPYQRDSEAMARCVVGSPVRLTSTSGTAELVATTSVVPSAASGYYEFNVSSTQQYFTPDTEIAFSGNLILQFRPSVTNPVVEGDLTREAVQAQHIAGTAIRPYHFNTVLGDTNTERENYSPVSTGSSDTDQWRWRRFDPYGAADAVRASLNQFEELVHDGIGAIPVEEDSDTRAPRQFTSIRFNRSGTRVISVTFGFDSEWYNDWSALDDLFDDQIPYASADVTVHMDVSYVDTDVSDTELTQLSFFINSTDPGGEGMLILDSDARTATFRIDTESAGNSIAGVDAFGNAVNIPSADFRGGNGYWRNVYFFDGLEERYPLEDQFDQIGDPIYNYFRKYNTVIPVIVDNDDANTPHVRLAGLGTGLTYDETNNVVNSAGGGGGSDPNLTFSNASGVVEGVALEVNDSDQSTLGVRFFPSDTVIWHATDGKNITAHVDTDHLADTEWVIGYVGSSAAQFNSSRYGVVSSTPSLDDTELRQRFLVGTNEWVTISNLPNNVHRFTYDSDGLVPAPNLPDSDTERAQQYALRANGTWIELPGQEDIFTANTPGLVPPPGQADEALFLTAGGHWRHTEEFIDSDIIVRALETLVSAWDTDDNSIELGTVVRVPATPGTASSNGSFAQYVITFAQDGSDNILHDGASMRFTCPRRQTNTSRNYDTETDYVDVVMTNPNISGFAYPPVNARGVRDIFYAILDPTTHGNNPPYADWIELNTTASDAVASNNQLVIGVSTRNPSSNGYGREGSVDTEEFIRRTFQFNGGQSSDFVMSASFYRNPDMDDSEQTGSWPTRATPGTPARDTEILILDQQIPIFGTTEQGNQTYEPGLVPEPESLERSDERYLSALGNWVALPADERGIDVVTVEGGNTTTRTGVTQITYQDARVIGTGTMITVADVFRGQYTSGLNYVEGEVVWARVNNQQSLWAADTDIATAPATFNQRDWNLIGSGHVFDSESNGLVPASGDSDTASHYLAGNGTWQPFTSSSGINVVGEDANGSAQAEATITDISFSSDDNSHRGAQTSGTALTVNYGLTYTDILNGPKTGPSRFLGSGELTDGTAWVRYSLDFIGGATDQNPFVIFYHENASGDPTTFDVYADSGSNPTSIPTTPRIARRTFSGSGDSITWADGA